MEDNTKLGAIVVVGLLLVSPFLFLLAPVVVVLSPAFLLLLAPLLLAIVPCFLFYIVQKRKDDADIMPPIIGGGGPTTTTTGTTTGGLPLPRPPRIVVPGAITDLKKEMEELRKKLASTEKDDDAEEIKALKQSLVNLAAKVKTLTDLVNGQDTDVDELTNNVTTLENTLKEQTKVIDELKVLKQNVAALENTIKEQAKTIKELEQKGPTPAPQPAPTPKKEVAAVQEGGATYGSSSYYPNCAPAQATLNGSTGWGTNTQDQNQFLQIALPVAKPIHAVATKGITQFRVWTKKYRLEYSTDGSTWNRAQQAGGGYIFTGNTDQNTTVKHTLATPVTARYLRFCVTEWYGRIAMRAEAYYFD